PTTPRARCRARSWASTRPPIPTRSRPRWQPVWPTSSTRPGSTRPTRPASSRFSRTSSRRWVAICRCRLAWRPGNRWPISSRLRSRASWAWTRRSRRLRCGCASGSARPPRPTTAAATWPARCPRWRRLRAHSRPPWSRPRATRRRRRGRCGRPARPWRRGRPGPGPGAGRLRVLQTGQRLALKPEHLTHLSGDEDLVPKTHPRIALRGQLEQLEAALLDAQVAASDAGARALVGELGEALELVRALVGAEVTGRPAPSPNLLGLDAAGIRHASHHTWELYRVPFMVPDVRQGAVVSRLNLARASARAAELAALHAFGRGLDPPEREDLVLALNRPRFQARPAARRQRPGRSAASARSRSNSALRRGSA